MTTYYIADTHFGHENIIRFCDRPFDNVQDMNCVIVENWNARVRPDDEVWIVGDFAYRSAESPTGILRELNGRKHLILGNHDFKWIKNVQLDRWFESVDMMAQTEDEGRRIVLCHYPLMTVPRHFVNVFGHIHNDRSAGYWSLLSTMENSLNAGVEVNGYQPVTLVELERNNAVWRSGSVS